MPLIRIPRTADALLPGAANARTHSAEQVAQMAASIAASGFAARHCSRRAEQGAEGGVPVADNRIAVSTGWDDALRAAEVAKRS